MADGADPVEGVGRLVGAGFCDVLHVDEGDGGVELGRQEADEGLSFGFRADHSPDLVAGAQQLGGDMGAEEAVDAGDQHSGAHGDERGGRHRTQRKAGVRLKRHGVRMPRRTEVAAANARSGAAQICRDG